MVASCSMVNAKVTQLRIIDNNQKYIEVLRPGRNLVHALFLHVLDRQGLIRVK